jgi:hypothetical protein
MSLINSFINKLYLMINNCDNDNIKWLDSNTSFVIKNPKELQKNMKGYFNSSKTNSFVRQLHFYGFKKIGGSRCNNWVFFNEYFTKDGSMLNKIKRNTSNNCEELLEKINEMNENNNKRFKKFEDELKLQKSKYNELKDKYNELKDKLKLQKSKDNINCFLFEPIFKRCKLEPESELDLLDPNFLNLNFSV